VLGGFLGIALPLSPAQLSLGVAAGLLAVWVAVTLRGFANLRRRSAGADPSRDRG
jgi:hypothetical protein